MSINAKNTASITRRAALALSVGAAVALTASPVWAADLAAKFKFDAASTATVDHSAWTNLLGKYVKSSPDGINYIDYAGFKDEDHDTLKGYVALLEKQDPTKLGRNEQYAYWANLYNAKTIDVVLDAYPVDSIRKITINEGIFGFLKKSAGLGGPWKAQIMTINGQKLSLDNVEHDIMRKTFNDPRVHYSVNCASMGCPNLLGEAFTGAKLDEQLDAGARAFINHPRGINVAADGSITASSIYSWFQVDFGGSAKGVLDHARQYANDDLKAEAQGQNRHRKLRVRLGPQRQQASDQLS